MYYLGLQRPNEYERVKIDFRTLNELCEFVDFYNLQVFAIEDDGGEFIVPRVYPQDKHWVAATGTINLEGTEIWDLDFPGFANGIRGYPYG